jgi:hypothetical protein
MKLSSFIHREHYPSSYIDENRAQIVSSSSLTLSPSIASNKCLKLSEPPSLPLSLTWSQPSLSAQMIPGTTKGKHHKDNKIDRKKKVEFDLQSIRTYNSTAADLCCSNNHHRNRHRTHDCDWSLLWYSKAELRQGMKELESYCLELRAADDLVGDHPYRYRHVLEETWDDCLKGETGDMMSVVSSWILPPNVATQLSSTLIYRLQVAIMSSPNRLGLEERTVLRLNHDRVTRRNRLLRFFKSVQKSRPPALGNSMTGVSSTDQEAKLRLASQYISRPSCLLAQALAEALACSEQR